VPVVVSVPESSTCTMCCDSMAPIALASRWKRTQALVFLVRWLLSMSLSATCR
jgi:hypothetical protein